MIDQEMDFSVAGQAWMAWPTEFAQTAAAVIAKTRHAWAPRAQASRALDHTGVDSTRFVQPLFGLAPDENDGSAVRPRFKFRSTS